MPEQYTEIKKSYEQSGKSEKEAKKLAAMTYIARGKGGNRHSRAMALHSDRPKKNKALSEALRK